MFEVKIISDSTHNGNRLTTFELEYCRYIHAELLMHREFSRSSQSSRAIPVTKQIEILEKGGGATPIFMKNQKGMAASERIEGLELDYCEEAWENAKENAIESAKELISLGVHKQIANRVLEPFITIKTILSSTSFENFFNLRTAPGAQQEMQYLAVLMKDLYTTNKPKKLDVGEYHLPYINEDEEYGYSIDVLKKLSVARCARVSYLNHNGVRDIQDDLRLYEQLVSERHASATEHVATPFPGRYGNFNGWKQHRQEINL